MSIKITKPAPPAVNRVQSPSSQPPEGHLNEVQPIVKQPVADVPRAPKTSPSPCLGDTVIFRTQEQSRQHNGSSDHVAIITRVWAKSVNLKVLPDCGDPYDATSQPRIAYQDEKGTGWFTIGEAKG